MSGFILKRVPVTILSGQSLSAAVFCQRLALVGLEMPAAWTDAALTFQAAADNDGAAGTFRDLYDWTGSEFAITTAAARMVPFDPRAFMVAEWVKVRSGTTAAAVNQGADRTINLILRSVA